MKTYSRRGDLAGPVLLIGFGALVLLINLGRISVSLWGALSQLWPLALIVIGLDLIIPRRSVLASAAVAIVLLAVVFLGAGLALPALSNTPSAEGGEPVRVASTGETQADVSLTGAAGTMSVEGARTGNELVTGMVSIPWEGNVEQTVRTEGDTTRVMLKTTGVVVVPIQFGTGEVWEIAVSGDPELELSAEMGAGEISIDGMSLNVHLIEASLGAGEIKVAVPEGATAKLSTAIGQLTVIVPEGASVRLTPSHLAGTVVVPEGYREISGDYLSPDFDEGDHIDIDASLVFGTITLREE